LETVKAIDILYVEDNPDDVELTMRALKKSKMRNRIHLARDGEEAIKFLDEMEKGEKPISGLILLDIKLPKPDGIEVLNNIKSRPRFRRIPVVMLTTSKNDLDIEACYDLGANSYIVKPVNFSDFIETVKNIELYWVLTNQPPAVNHT